MQLTSILLTFAGVASAVNVRLFYNANCGGTVAQCSNIGSGVCCYAVRDNDLRGFPSIGVTSASQGTQIFGYQRTRDGNRCGSIAGQVGIGASSSGCLNINSALGEFAAGRWYPANPRRFGKRDTCAPTDTEQCTGAALADRLGLEDGKTLNIEGVEGTERVELFKLAVAGAKVEELPEKFAALEVSAK